MNTIEATRIYANQSEETWENAAKFLIDMGNTYRSEGSVRLDKKEFHRVFDLMMAHGILLNNVESLQRLQSLNSRIKFEADGRKVTYLGIEVEGSMFHVATKDTL